MQPHGIKEGMTVYTADNQKLGTIMRCGPDSFLIEKGIFFTKDYVAHLEDVREVREGYVYLKRNLAEFRVPTSEVPTGTGCGTTAASGQTQAGARAGAEQLRVPLKEETLEVQKAAREVGEVRIKKEVKVEEKQVTIPVTREEVKIERVPATGGPLKPGETELREGEVRVPIREEEVIVSKRPVVKEEIRVTKDVREEPKTVRETIKKETAHIEKKDDERKRRTA